MKDAIQDGIPNRRIDDEVGHRFIGIWLVISSDPFS
jgi:hypothetical protein